MKQTIFMFSCFTRSHFASLPRRAILIHMSSWRLGTMGYSYDDWIGPFFPAGLPRSDWLSFYAQHHNCIELNTTFHAIPVVERVQAWRDAVPEDFRFAVKVNHQITHALAMRHATALMNHFVDAMRPMGKKLGVMLLQYPPTLASADWSGLALFVESLPKDVRFAMEFRHRSWLSQSTFDLLARHNVALVMLDHEDHPWALKTPVTADFAYVRLVGKHDRYEELGFEQRDPSTDLDRWKERLEWCEQDSPLREKWVLFNNDYAGHAPATLRRFRKLIGDSSSAAPPTLFD